MSKKSLLFGLLTTAVLTVPFSYKKEENGDVKVRAVLYDVDVTTDGDQKSVSVNVGSFISQQIKAVKDIVKDYKAAHPHDDKDDIDADFESLGEFEDFDFCCEDCTENEEE